LRGEFVRVKSGEHIKEIYTARSKIRTWESEKKYASAIKRIAIARDIRRTKRMIFDKYQIIL